MHLLATASASIDDLVEAVDLRQSPGDIVILSFADSDLSGLAAAWGAQRHVLPTARLHNLRALAPSTLGRPLARHRGTTRKGRRGPPAWRPRLVALRRRAAVVAR